MIAVGNIGVNRVADSVESILFRCPVGMNVIVPGNGVLPEENFFGGGIYARSLFRPAGTFLVGHKHKTEHMALLVSGRLRVLCDGEVKEIVGPSKPFTVKAGTRKVTLAIEDSTLITFHSTKTTDLEELEDELIEKSDFYKQMEASGDLEKLRKFTSEEMPTLST